MIDPDLTVQAASEKAELKLWAMFVWLSVRV